MKHRVFVFLGVWLAAAALFTYAGGLRLYGPPYPLPVPFMLLFGLLAGFGLWAGFRSWLYSLPPTFFVALHLSRFVGVYFLALHRRGELPYDFAVLGGWGDILVASLAMILLLAPSRVSSIRSPWLHGWNLLGLADILFVVATAARLTRASPGSMSSLTILPLGLLPSFLVPLIIFTHIVVALSGVRARRHAAD